MLGASAGGKPKRRGSIGPPEASQGYFAALIANCENGANLARNDRWSFRRASRGQPGTPDGLYRGWSRPATGSTPAHNHSSRAGRPGL